MRYRGRVLAKGHRIFGYKSMQLERWSPKVQHFNKRMHTNAVWVRILGFVLHFLGSWGGV